MIDRLNCSIEEWKLHTRFDGEIGTLISLFAHLSLGESRAADRSQGRLALSFAQSETATVGSLSLNRRDPERKQRCGPLPRGGTSNDMISSCCDELVVSGSL